MIERGELMVGNYVFVPLQVGCDEFKSAIVRVREIKEYVISYKVDYPNSLTLREESSRLRQLTPVPLNAAWRDLFVSPDHVFPGWINSVHQFQNWYYWTHDKRELDYSKIPKTDGDNMPHSSLDRFLRLD